MARAARRASSTVRPATKRLESLCPRAVLSAKERRDLLSDKAIKVALNTVSMPIRTSLPVSLSREHGRLRHCPCAPVQGELHPQSFCQYAGVLRAIHEVPRLQR